MRTYREFQEKYQDNEKIDRLILDIISDKSRTKDPIINAGIANGTFNFKCNKPKITFQDLINIRKEIKKKSQTYQLYRKYVTE